MFLLVVVLIAASGFFLLRAAASKRIQVESTLGRIPGYGYGEPARTNDPRAWLRRIGRIAPGGRVACFIPKPHLPETALLRFERGAGIGNVNRLADIAKREFDIGA